MDFDSEMSVTIKLQKERTRMAAIGYIKEQVAQGKSLSKLLLETLDFEKGETAAVSAVPLDPEEIIQYSQGHARLATATPQSVVIEGRTYVAYPTPSAKEQLAELIYGLLGHSMGGLCLLENFLSDAGDPWLKRAKSRLLFHGSEVYHALFNVDRDKAKISTAISEAENLPVFVGAVGSTPSDIGPDIASVSTITTEQLTDFAKTVYCVFVGAYDGEGYLVWKRPSA